MPQQGAAPLVSVIIPTFNRAGVLIRSVQSVQCQSFPDFEIIVVDDGSTDETRSRLAELRDPRLRYIRHDRNMGAAAARNTGIDLARGEWVAFQDSDDIWLPPKLEVQLAIAEACGNPVVVYTGFVRFNGSRASYNPEPHVKRRSGNILAELVHGPFIGMPTMLVPRSCFADVGGFDTALGALEDWELCLRLAERYEFLNEDYPLVVAHHTPGNLSSDVDAFTSAMANVLERHQELFMRCPEYMASHLTFLAHCLCATGNVALARRHLKQALRLNRRSVPAWAVFMLSFFGSTLYGAAARWRRPGLIYD